MIRMARNRFVRLASGSPIPMKTMFVDRFARSPFQSRAIDDDLACSRLRANPSSPLRKIYSHTRSPLGGDAGRMPIGSLAVKRGRGRDEDRFDQAAVGETKEKLARVSFAPSTRTTSGLTKRNSSARRARVAAGRSVMASKDPTRFL